MHRNAELIFEKHALSLIGDGATVLEVGAGRKWWKSVFRKLAIAHGWVYRFCDPGNWGSDQLDFVRQPGNYSIASERDVYDAVIASQVIEHVDRPWRWVPELARIAKPGGVVVLVCPITWGHHRYPIDAFRVLPDGMKVLFADAGLTPVVCSLESLDQDLDSGKHVMDRSGPGRIWDCIGIGRKPC